MEGEEEIFKLTPEQLMRYSSNIKKWTDDDMVDFAYYVDWANEESLKNWIEAGKPKRQKFDDD